MIELDLIPAPVLEVKGDGTVIGANQSAQDCFQRKLIGEPIGKLIKDINKKFINALSESGMVEIEVDLCEKIFLFTARHKSDSQSFYLFGCNITALKQAQRIHAETEAMFNSITSAAQDGIIIIDHDGAIIYWNQAAEQMFGYTAAEASGKDVHELIALPRYRSSASYGFKHFRETGQGNLVGKVTEIEGRKKNGEEIPIELSMAALKGQDGWYAASILRDISIRRKYEDELRNQQKNLEKQVRVRTRELEQITHEMEETQLALTYLMEDVNEAREEIQQTNLQLIKEVGERRAKEKELEAKSDELNVSLKEVESARDKIDGILKSIADGLIVTDFDNKIVLINEVAQRLFKVTQEQALNKKLDDIIKDETIRRKFNFTLSDPEEGYEFDFELSLPRNKKPSIFSALASNIRNKRGEMVGIITIFRDVTEQKELDRMKTEFISTSAHELRTPLTSIQGFAEILLIRDNLKPFEEKRYLNYILSQAKRLARIISNLLDISRIESGKGIILQKESCLMGEMIRQIVSNFGAESKDHSFIVDVKEESENLLADKEKVEQIITNLIANAVKYTPEGREIRVTAQPLEHDYQVSVEDQGVGMTREQVNRVFEKFYRGDTSNTAVEGTGLGMSIVKNNVEAHGGKIKVESKPKMGTKVTFTLPLGSNHE